MGVGGRESGGGGERSVIRATKYSPCWPLDFNRGDAVGGRRIKMYCGRVVRILSSGQKSYTFEILLLAVPFFPPPTSCSQGGELYVWWWWWLFPRVRGFWENVRLFIPRLRFFFLLLFFFLVEISLRKLIPLFRLGSVHSG